MMMMTMLLIMILLLIIIIWELIAPSCSKSAAQRVEVRRIQGAFSTRTITHLQTPTHSSHLLTHVTTEHSWIEIRVFFFVLMMVIIKVIIMINIIIILMMNIMIVVQVVGIAEKMRDYCPPTPILIKTLINWWINLYYYIYLIIYILMWNSMAGYFTSHASKNIRPYSTSNSIISDLLSNDFKTYIKEEKISEKKIYIKF